MTEPNTSDSRRESESIDTHLSVLASTECRYVVYYFRRTPEDVASLDDLARFVEANAGPATDRSREQLRAILHHKALPKLAESGVVEYDHREGSVRYHGTPALEELATIAARKERQMT